MTEPQVWTMIGVMVAALVAILTIVAQSFQLGGFAALFASARESIRSGILELTFPLTHQ